MGALNLNKTILGGRLTADVELKQTASGVSVCSFTLAVNRRRSSEGEQTADFINCVAWRSTAEFISKYFRKGSSLCIVGNIQTRSWTDQNGQKRFATEVIADEAMFVDSRNEGGENQPSATPTAIKPNEAEFEDLNTDSDLPF
jgi:single-strand DNA-binding protein